jgi:hypothetical protein
MVRSIRRIDPRKVEQIKELIRKCIDAGFSREDIIFTEYKAIPDGTRLEHIAANYPLYYIADTKRKKKVIDPEIRQLYDQELRRYNKDTKDMSSEVIAVDHMFRDLEGRTFKLSYLQLAEDKKAKVAADRLDPVIKGLQTKKGRLLEMSEDPELKKVHDAKMRALRRLLDRKRKDKE